VVVIVLAAGALTAVAIAEGLDSDGRGDRVLMMGNDPSGQGRGSQDGWSGDGSRAPGMMGPNGGMMNPGEGRGVGGAQLSDEQRQQVIDLMNEHRADMRAWWQKYGDAPGSEAAQEALQKLRNEHVQEMQELFEELGIQGVGRGMWRDGGTDSNPDGSGAPCPGWDQSQDSGARQSDATRASLSTSAPGYGY
jgi:hypothetical protein